MPSHEEQQRRKGVRSALRQAEREQIKATLHMPLPRMKALFDFIDQKLSESECDDTLRHTIAFLNEHQIPPADVVSWLEQAGGYCDCEVMANVEEKLESILPD